MYLHFQEKQREAGMKRLQKREEAFKPPEEKQPAHKKQKVDTDTSVDVDSLKKKIKQA